MLGFVSWGLDLSSGCLDLSIGCLELSVGCLELSVGCLELSVGCLAACEGDQTSNKEQFFFKDVNLSLKQIVVWEAVNKAAAIAQPPWIT